MVSVYLVRPASSPNLYAQWIVPGTTRRKTRSLRTADEKVAERRRAELEYELNHALCDERPRLRWEEFVARYDAEKLAELKPESRQKTCGILERFGRVQRPAAVSAVTTAMVSAHAAHLRKDGMKPISIRSHLTRLGASLRWAVRLNLLAAVPHIEGVRVPRRGPIRTLPAARFGELLALMPTPSWVLFAQVAWYTGMRAGELFRLEWSADANEPWLDLKAGRVRFPAGSCKSGREEWTPLHPDLAVILHAVRQPSGRVFDLAGCRTRLSRLFCKLARPLGIKTHDLRRSFGSRYAPLVPAQILQRLMRHADIHTTLEYYTDLDPSLEEAIRRV